MEISPWEPSVVRGSISTMGKVQGLYLSDNAKRGDWSEKTKAKLTFVAFEAKEPVMPCISSFSKVLLDFIDNSKRRPKFHCGYILKIKDGLR